MLQLFLINKDRVKRVVKDALLDYGVVSLFKSLDGERIIPVAFGSAGDITLSQSLGWRLNTVYSVELVEQSILDYYIECDFYEGRTPIMVPAGLEGEHYG